MPLSVTLAAILLIGAWPLVRGLIDLCSQGLCLFSPHTWRESFFIWAGDSTLLKLNFLTRLCPESHYSAVGPALENKGGKTSLLPTLFFLSDS